MGDLNSSCNHITVYTPVVSCFDEDEVCYMECARNETVVKRDCSKDNATSTSRRYVQNVQYHILIFGEGVASHLQTKMKSFS